VKICFFINFLILLAVVLKRLSGEGIEWFGKILMKHTNNANLDEFSEDFFQ
jgi:hypothetical protein